MSHFTKSNHQWVPTLETLPVGLVPYHFPDLQLVPNTPRRCQCRISFIFEYNAVKIVVLARVFLPHVLSSGITGGFAPPDPKAVKSVSYTAETKTLQITSSTSPSSNLAPVVVKKDDSVDKSIEELQSILKSIPTEEPKGSEDIYGLDTSIMWGSDDLVWENTGAQGCGGISTVKATAEHKAKFKRALEIAEALVAKGFGS